ncbi:hypothetical protein HY967_01255, partial [Candidatus Jorgensenbacteria bacterium]|nr:hypothetical protein [Candidatus Jorgensenbacteria bacterium]
ELKRLQCGNTKTLKGGFIAHYLHRRFGVDLRIAKTVNIGGYLAGIFAGVYMTVWVVWG